MPTEHIEEARRVLSTLTDEEKRELSAEFGLKTPTGWRALLADGKLPTTVVGWLIASVSTWMMVRGTSNPEEKISYFTAWSYSTVGVWSALMVALGIQKAASNTGTVPEGRMAIPNVVAPAAPIIVPVVKEKL